MIYLPLAPKAKARPRAAGRFIYMPRDYQEWRKSFVALWRTSKAAPKGMEGHLRLDVQWATKTGNMQPDCDNAYGAICDALQDAGAYANDKQVKAGSFALVQATDEQPAGHYITITKHSFTKSTSI